MIKLTPIRAIKQYCRFKCSNNDLESWKECFAKDCPLHGYRLGKRPKKQADSPIIQAKQGILQETA